VSSEARFPAVAPGPWKFSRQFAVLLLVPHHLRFLFKTTPSLVVEGRSLSGSAPRSSNLCVVPPDLFPPVPIVRHLEVRSQLMLSSPDARWILFYYFSFFPHSSRSSCLQPETQIMNSAVAWKKLPLISLFLAGPTKHRIGFGPRV